MPPVSIESAVYAFEGLLPELESPPIAARRALDHAGLRLPVEAWRSLSLEDRQRVTIAGVADRVDADLVASLLHHATPTPQRISPVHDPDPAGPPETLAKALEPTRAIDPKRWARLRAVDRYALAHTYRRAVARSAFSILGDAFDVVLAASTEAPASAGPRPSPASSGEAHRDPLGIGALSTDSGRFGRPPPSPPAQEIASPDAPRLGFTTAPPPAGSLSNHLNQAGEVHMVDVARKPKTERRAIARGSVFMRPETLQRLVSRDAPKGEVLATARVAAVTAAKRTHELIPLCHLVALTHLDVGVEIDAGASAVHVTATADAYDRTGCEMEAMIAVSTACLTIYDMLKGIDRDMVISDMKLMEKSGGRSGHYRRSDSRP